MLFYMVIFLSLGVAIGLSIKQISIGIISIVVITIGWYFVYGPWAIATFIELLIGYAVAKNVAKAGELK